LISLALLFHGSALLGQEMACQDVLRTELRDISTRREKHAEARLFLWSHWSENKCGELFLTAWSKEGVRTDSHYKIETTHENRMVLTVTLHTSEDPNGPVDALAVTASGHIARQPVNDETSSYQAYGVERVRPDVPFILEKAKLVPTNKVVPPSKYLLRFRDKDDKVIADF
jgi:hypothetical protein